MFKRSQEPKKEEGQDLHSILDTHQRGELIRLLGNATSSMRKAIEDTFDSTQVAKESNHLEGKAIDEKISEEKKADKDKEALERQKKRAKELSEPSLQELKTKALEFFDEWQDRVSTRIVEVVNSEKEEKTPIEKTAPTQDAKVQTVQKIVDDETEDEDLNKALHEFYPPIKTPLADLKKEHRLLILQAMLLLLLSLEHYNAHSRILLLYITSCLNLPLQELGDNETKVSKGLLEAAKKMTGDSETKERVEANKNSRAWKVGLASVAGAVVIGVTGGLAAPLIAAALGTIFGSVGLATTAAAGYLGAVAESGVIVGALFGAYGGRMTGKMMDEYARQVEDFAFLPVHPPKHRRLRLGKDKQEEDRRLRVAIGTTGWLTSPEEIIIPWRIIDDGAEAFALRWEVDAQLKLGNAMDGMLKSAAWSIAKGQILKRTVLGVLSEALWPLQLLKVSRVIDNPFSVAKSRADKAGEVLADALIHKAQGERPVTLIGYSLGARLIYSCLRSLAARHAFGLIESAVLIGTPAPSEDTDWRCIRSVVSGRLVNVYSENDYVLGFMYRSSSIQYGVAGLQDIKSVKGIESINVSKMVSGHLRYKYLTGSILKKIGYEDIDVDEVEQQEETLRLVDMHDGLEDGADKDITEDDEKAAKEIANCSEKQDGPKKDVPKADVEVHKAEQQVEALKLVDTETETVVTGDKEKTKV